MTQVIFNTKLFATNGPNVVYATRRVAKAMTIKIDHTWFKSLVTAHQSTYFDPETIRALIIKLVNEGKISIEEVDFCVTTLAMLGPNPDLYKKKMERRTTNNSENRRKLNDAIAATVSILKKLIAPMVLRGSQLLACFPDKHYCARLWMKSNGAVLRTFIDINELPAELQAPGLGPIIEEKYMKAYEVFSEVFSRTISQGMTGVNTQILDASFKWHITLDGAQLAEPASDKGYKVTGKEFTDNMKEDIKLVGSRKDKPALTPALDAEGKEIAEDPRFKTVVSGYFRNGNNEASFKDAMAKEASIETAKALAAQFVNIKPLIEGKYYVREDVPNDPKGFANYVLDAIKRAEGDNLF